MSIVKPTVPVGTEVINYTIARNGTVLFTGKSKYFGGDYEVDVSDWIETILNKETTSINQISLEVNFTFDDNPAVTTIVKTWTTSITPLTPVSTATTPYVMIQTMNSGFRNSQHGELYVPLMMCGDRLVCKTTNNLDKVTYMDRYGDTHNGGIKNKYEIECFVDPEWLHTETGEDLNYEIVMTALQASTKTTLYGSGVKISGFAQSSPYTVNTEGRVKDIEKVETYSSYSTEKKVPTLKITFEMYR